MTSAERQDSLPVASWQPSPNGPTPHADLSIIIVNWNTRDLLAQCLESVAGCQMSVVRHQSSDTNDRPTGDRLLTTDVWVVDNASSDGSAQMVRERFPWVRLIENEENVGFARANNQAIRRSNGRYVLLLNPDTEVQPGALETLVRFMDEHPQAGAAGARLLNPDGTLQPSCHPMPTLSRELWRLVHLDAFRSYAVYQMAAWDLALPRQVDVVQGACLILRREVLDNVGLLDEEYFIYSEEVDLCYRIWRAGWRIFWVPQAGVVHYEGQSTRQVAPQMFLRLYEGKVLFFRKNQGWVAAQIYKLILLATALARLAISPLAWLERRPRRDVHLALAGHYWQLLRALPGF
ncbi:MAG: glycosyltransferase family 2 protein [Chloroflexi bacterium]|nr:glycosyltransferase family 2 protein [Chloroflexota bacterium]